VAAHRAVTLPAADLKRLSALLDQALDLDASQHERWLRGLRSEPAGLVRQLRELLAGRGAKETADLLDRGPAVTVPADTGATDGTAGGTGAAFSGGDAVGPYRLISLLGRGGMGEVWLAERADGVLKRPVALKLPTLGLRRGVLVQRFARERDILAGLVHPHIARLYDAGQSADRQPYLALEHVEGQPITAYCTSHVLGARERVQLLLQVMDAVQFAHANLVIHRDLKPANVLVTPQGRAMLLDFGIAKLLQDDETAAAETELTRLGGRAMTLDYAAPEQLNGGPISIAIDVWALGVLAYELLAGQRPFTRATRRATEHAVLHEELARIEGAALPRGWAADLNTIVGKALKKSPAERYATVNALADDLQRWLAGQPVLARADSAGYRARKFIGRNKAAVAMAAAITAVLVGASAVSVQQAQRAQAQSRIAQTEARTAQAVQAFLEDILRANSADQPDPIKARQRTAKELLDAGAARIDKALDDAPAAKLRVLNVLGEMYGHMDDYERRIELNTAAVELAGRAFPGPSAERARALASLATVLASNARQSQAGAVLREAMAIADQNPALDHALRTEIAMAYVQDNMRRDDTAGLPAAARLVTLLSGKPPGDDLVGALYMRGRLQRVAGQPALAVQDLEQALRVAAQVPGGAAGGLSTLHIELSRSRAATGDLAGAERDQRQALELARRSTGPASRTTVFCTQVLARLLSDMGRPLEALPLLEQARRDLAAWPDDLTRAQSLVSTAVTEMTVWLHLGQPQRALAAMPDARGTRLDQLDDPRQRAALHLARGQALVELGRLQEGGAEFDAGARLATERKVAGTTRRDLLLAQARLALLQGATAAAQARWRELQPGGQAQVPLALALAADIEAATEGPAAALALASRHLAAFDAGPAALEQAYARQRLLMVSARALSALGRAAEARVMLDEVQRLASAIRGSAGAASPGAR